MNRLFYVLLSIGIFILLGFSITAYVAMYEPIHYHYYYEYTNLEGKMGVSSYCYTREEDGKYFCRTAKRAYPVQNYKKIRGEK